MSDLKSLFHTEEVASFVGVIDLKDGSAVHAVQGKRDQYQPAEFCCGDAELLLQHYVQLGIRRFYIADLDAITMDDPNTNLIVKLASVCDSIDDCDEIIFDLGWRGGDCSRSTGTKLIEQLSKQFKKSCWIAATETMTNPASISELVDVVGSEKAVLGLDYRDGRLQGQRFQGQRFQGQRFQGQRLQSQEFDESDWIIAANQAGIRRFLLLDLSSVGSKNGPATVDSCKRIFTSLRGLRDSCDPLIYSGGGIRSDEDVRALSRSGCNRFLLATALYPRAVY
ncbi:HisA/HisF-related TIM barrel protein [Rubripirellula obstinata]|uniref:HisA/HisF-related TIM barrel protein n=1 Tax=Rubripirellula obstinata TaxID=406547 RepID=UPI00135B9CB1|nr:HisA/HisF-related TIM barrel protein [Rubripirellula obstinata]